MHGNNGAQHKLEERLRRLRRKMVEHQLRARGIKDERILKAFAKVPRHCFVHPEDILKAYEDHPLPIGYEQTISQPYMVATMTEALQLTGEEKCLEVGAGSGYQVAILAELAREVYGIERILELAEQAARVLRELGYQNAHIVASDGTKGLPEQSPFDAIVVSAAAKFTPPSLLQQLADSGRLVIPLGSKHSQLLVRFTRRGDEFTEESICTCVFVPLIGEGGWKEDELFMEQEEEGEEGGEEGGEEESEEATG